MKRVLAFGLLLSVVFAVSPALALEKQWSDEGEISFVNTTGNTKVTSLAVKNDMKYHFTEDLVARLRGYFNNPAAAPHPWFTPWDNALQHIGLSHREGAAHLDLSPRATRSMQSCPEHVFLKMVEQDVKWLFKILPCCENAKVIMLAGTVTKRHYMNRFIEKVAPSHGYELCKLKRMPNTTGKAPVSFHVLVGGERCFNIFFCGVSPSARDAGLLAQRVQENSRYLVQWLNKTTRRCS